MALKRDDIINNRFEIIKELAIGGFGNVYQAYDHHTNSNVAIKAEKGEDDSSNKQLGNESSIYEYLSKTIKNQADSPITNLLSKDIDPILSVNYIVLPFCGPDLRKLKKRTPYDRFSLHTSLWTLRKIIDILEFLHVKCKLIHRDIKPANFLISSNDMTSSRDIRIVDFGLTKKAKQGKVKNEFLGTQRYSSLNAMKGEYVYYSDDLWSVYYLSVENINGALPWRKENKSEIINGMKELIYQDPYTNRTSPNPWFCFQQKEPYSMTQIRLDLVKDAFKPSKYAIYKCLLDGELKEMEKLYKHVKLDWEIKIETPDSANFS